MACIKSPGRPSWVPGGNRAGYMPATVPRLAPTWGTDADEAERSKEPTGFVKVRRERRGDPTSPLPRLMP